MGLKYASVLIFVLWLLICCKPPEQNDSPFEKGVSLGTNKNKHLEEPSGLVASIRNPGFLWTHNDSGNRAELFLLDQSNASTKKVFKFSNIANRDWEDITIGPGPVDSLRYIYLGDIGDNVGIHPIKYIYRTTEPSLNDPEEITDFDTLSVKLSGDVRDVEALMCDPVSKNLYLISKRTNGAGLYEITFPFTDTLLIATKVLDLPLKHVNAADISVDGNEVLVKNYFSIYYWKKTGTESLVDLLRTPPIELSYEREPQGESVAWARDGSGFYTLSENAKGERGKLLFYKRK